MANRCLRGSARDDPIEIGPEFRCGPVASGRLKKVQEGILDDVRSVLLVSGEAIGDPPGPGLMAIHKAGKRGHVGLVDRRHSQENRY